MEIFLYSVVGIMGLGAIGAQWAYSRLLDIEFTDFHEEWLADGRPIPVFGGGKSRKQASFLRSASASSDCLQRWLLSTPQWAKSSREAILLLKRLRIFGTLMFAGLFTIIGVVIWRMAL